MKRDTTPTRKAGVEIYKDHAGDWRWHARATNGRIVAASSEGFRRRATCVRNLRLTVEALRGWRE